MSSLQFSALAALVVCPAVLAAAPPVAGGLMQQIVPVATSPEVPRPSSLGATQANPTPAPDTRADNTTLLVKHLRVSGSTVYPERDLLALTGFQPGSSLTLTELQAMATRVTDHYRRNGYFVARAYLPAQDIQNGEVTIEVIEGRYGQVSVSDSAGLSPAVTAGILDGVNPGEPVAADVLESRLLMLSDLPGVNVRSTLVPGASLGASDLMVEVTPGKRVSGHIDIDNAGNRYTGVGRLGATLNLNNLAGRGDVASLRAMTSGSGLDYARASYQMQFGKARAGVAYSHMGYSLGHEFDALGATGTARIASVFGSYPLVRSRSANLNAGLALDSKVFDDHMASTQSSARKKSQALMASLYGDQQDRQGISTYSLTWTAGNIDLQNPVARSIDAATARSNGHFNKLGFGASRLQSLTDTLSVYGAINGQFSNKNLDVSEKMELGGMYAVRAYPEGEAYGDQGYVVTLEARWRVAQAAWARPNQLYLIAFVDAGTVEANKRPWDAGTNRRTLSGAGVGVNWTVANDLVVRAYYARKLGNEAATSAPDKSGRFWIQAVKYF